MAAVSPLASEIMLRFAARTSVADATAAAATRRYLWTDAFAVSNFLALGRADLALALVDRVHHTLGRYSRQDPRTGWLGGGDDEAREAHPTLGGLRIGKPMLERAPGQQLDERLEWDRDGQYFHYLTKWMHALDQVARATRDPVFNGWARELADVACRKFVHGSPPRMYWKMSVDLSRPLVPSMGQHDPLDGFVTCRELATTAAELGGAGPTLADATATFAAMIDRRGLATADPLGIGGLLVDAERLARLPTRDRALIDVLLTSAMVGLEHYTAGADLDARAAYRLAFRELGLAIGLSAAAAMPELTPGVEIAQLVSLRDEIEAFWVRPEHRASRAWMDHEDINDVMLATSLLRGKDR